MNADVLSNVAAERAIVGAVILDPSCLAHVRDLRVEHFFGLAERAAWDAIRSLESDGKAPSDHLLVWDRIVQLGEAGKFQEGPGTLTSWAGEAYAVGNVGFLADTVVARWKSRRLLLFAEELRRTVDEGRTDVDEIIAKAAADLSVISVGRAKLELVADWDRFVDDLEERAVAASNGTRAPGSGVPCGIASLDQIFLGARAKNTTVIAAPPGGGKSSLARQWALDVAGRGGAAMLISLEMSREECLEAMYAHLAGISSYKLDKGFVSKDDFQRVWAARRKIAKLDITIDDAAFDVSQIEAVVSQWAATRSGRELCVFVDYVQLVEAADIGRRTNRAELIAAVSRRLKRLAMRSGVPIVIVAQLNRAGLKSVDEPTMHDLEGSGSLEKDASTVIIVQVMVGEDEKPTTEAIARVVKQRKGPRGRVPLTWIAPTYEFRGQPFSNEERPHFTEAK